MLLDKLQARIEAAPRARPKLKVVRSARIENQIAPEPALDTTPKARKMRAITRIADRHSWHCAITHFLDTRGAAYLSDLNELQVDDLLDRMHGYVDAAEVGASLEDCFPAT